MKLLTVVLGTRSCHPEELQEQTDYPGNIQSQGDDERGVKVSVALDHHSTTTLLPAPSLHSRTSEGHSAHSWKCPWPRSPCHKGQTANRTLLPPDSTHFADMMLTEQMFTLYFIVR